MNQFIRNYQGVDYSTKIVHNMDSINFQYQLKIFQMNIRSISLNFDELLLLLESTPQKFEIIILTETFHIDDPEVFTIPGYTGIYNEGGFNRNDGIMVYVKRGITFSHEVVTLGHMRVVDLDLFQTSSGQKTKITAVYKSPRIDISDFNRNLIVYL